MPATAASDQALELPKPRHPLAALTTYELRDYRLQLERAVAFFDSQNPATPVPTGLQTALDSVLAEQDDRARIAHA